MLIAVLTSTTKIVVFEAVFVGGRTQDVMTLGWLNSVIYFS